MTKRNLFVFAFANTLVVALLASYLTAKWHSKHAHHHSSHQQERDFHSWIHTQLKLSPEQEVSLQPAEEEFGKRSIEIRKQIQRASQNLAQAVKSGDPSDPQIDVSLGKISNYQLDHKKLIIEHFFEMKEHLEPEQAEKVRQWIHESLTSSSSSRQ